METFHLPPECALDRDCVLQWSLSSFRCSNALCVSTSAFSKIIHIFLFFLERISTAFLWREHESLIITSFNQRPSKLPDLKCCLPSLSGGWGIVSPGSPKINSSNSLLTSQWMYLVQFRIKHFFTLQLLHKGFIFVQELPTRRDLFVFSFYSRIFRILDSMNTAACTTFLSFQVLTSPHVLQGPVLGKLLTLITTSPKTWTFPFQCHCNWIPHLGSPFQQHQCCLSLY